MQKSKERSAVTSPGVDRGQQRILRWLERYPFQRIQDLVVALSPWEGRGAVYRRIADLAARELIESVRLGASTREKLYHLSPRGRAACVAWDLESAWQGQRTPLILREEREKLVNLLPRVPVWLVVQDLVNGLVQYASRALARVGTGEEASAVRWNWLREYRHAFVERGQAGRVFSMRADGALSLCLSFSEQQEEWHSLLILHCPLDDARLLRHRLDRLVRWRESAERQAEDSQMPPVLMLATTPRQAEWWQLAAAQVATRLHAEVPLGAVAILPENGQIENSWRLAWRTLGTNAPCHLQELMHPVYEPTLPELREKGTSQTRREHHGSLQQEATHVAHLPTYAGRRLYALTTAAHEANKAASTRSGESHPVDYRLVSVFLAPRHWEILSLCFAHPLLARDELSILLGLRPKPVQMLLADLAHNGLVVRKETPIGGRWHLTEAGLRLMARRASCHVHRFVRVPVTPGVPLQQRGLAGLVHQIRHTAGIYAFFSELVKSLATTSGASLRWWETGALCEHVFTYRENIFHFKPDALAAVQIGARQVRFWLEWDRGTMGVQELEHKCATYAAYLSSREWARGGVQPPVLLYVAPEIGQERRFVRTACALLAHIPGFHLSTTTASLMARYGVQAPIWQTVLPQTLKGKTQVSADPEDGSPAEHVPRVALFGEA